MSLAEVWIGKCNVLVTHRGGGQLMTTRLIKRHNDRSIQSILHVIIKKLTRARPDCFASTSQQWSPRFNNVDCFATTSQQWSPRFNNVDCFATTSQQWSPRFLLAHMCKYLSFMIRKYSYFALLGTARSQLMACSIVVQVKIRKLEQLSHEPLVCCGVGKTR
jgi:hypothetical protein